ncbi:MAG: hypothetical protein N4A35_16380 [Flavobacteriales bacterium]|jgi:antitoxin component YwqK of YwqJK toxin-antitoxin module|nr:hypothetical protein [Flavobacteriales bacterium]
MRIIKLIILFVVLSCYHSAWGQKKVVEVTLDINGVLATVQLDDSGKEYKVKLNETYFWYKSNKVIQTVGGYQGKLLNGYYIESYPNGQLKLKGCFCRGQQCGEWKYWNEEGKLQRVEQWKQNQLHGKVTYFKDTGEVALVKEFKKGVEASKE